MKVTFKQTIPMQTVPKELRNSLKESVGTFLVESILEDVSKSKSPVKDGEFKASLSPAYKKKKQEISGSTSANMELYGDMLNALKFENKRDGIEIGIFDSQQALKADNHNKFSAKSKKTALPKREFIPKTQGFREGIKKGIADIVAEYSVEGTKKSDILKEL